MEADSGRVLLAHNELAEKPIASTTKIMTALVALEHSSLTDTVTVKPEHLLEGSSMYLRDGETLTMEALLYGLMLPSGNDAAACIADNCGHGSENFVRWMNEKAASLGMTHTRFANPSGLDEDGHYSCALDMARLMAFAMRQPEFARIVSAKTATAGERVMGNHNKLLGTVPGCDGGKTGYTGAAGRTLVTCAQRGGMRLVAVTLHDGSDWQDHKAMYEYGFSAYHTERAVCRGACCAICAVRGGESTFVEARAQRGFFYPVAQDEKLTLRVELNETVHSPVRAGQTLGSAVVLLDGAEVGRVPLTAANDVETAPSAEERTSLADRLRGIWHAAA
ncbi:MAG: D-alanyl-D-alanine carboxypeptidase [Oscillospiraceae bacterium]|nr:D-alanyl-D-alanine carboxypeptidase [Oscillospiraceae bacterium]